jgi:hypothetical protein
MTPTPGFFSDGTFYVDVDSPAGPKNDGPGDVLAFLDYEDLHGTTEDA